MPEIMDAVGQTMDIQARRDIAVLQIQQVTTQNTLEKIDTTLNRILLTLLTGVGGAAGAALWTFAFHLKQ